MNIAPGVTIIARQFVEVDKPLAGMKEGDRITGTFNQFKEEYFYLTGDHGDLSMSLNDWIIEFVDGTGNMFYRTVVSSDVYNKLFARE